MQVDGRRLVVGRPGGLHVGICPRGVSHMLDKEEVAMVDWDDISSMRLDVATTRFKLKGYIYEAALLGASLLIGDSIGADADDGKLVVEYRNGSSRVFAFNPHQVGGYPKRSVEVADSMLRRFTSEPGFRNLLNHPTELVRISRGAAW